jgi:RNA polymerase sigma-70 factor, ECF subfamily
MKPPHSGQNDLDDRAVVQKVKQGERDAFRLLIDRYKDRVFNLICRQVGSRELAEDLSQETFLKAFKAIGEFREESQFSTWLIRIAFNTSNTYLSSRAYRTSSLHASDQTDYLPSNDNPVLQHDVKETLIQFRRCFAKLGPRFREVVALCGYEERSYEEVADILFIPIGTVKSRLNKARLLLKDCLAHHLT